MFFHTSQKKFVLQITALVYSLIAATLFVDTHLNRLVWMSVLLNYFTCCFCASDCITCSVICSCKKQVHKKQVHLVSVFLHKEVKAQVSSCNVCLPLEIKLLFLHPICSLAIQNLFEIIIFFILMLTFICIFVSFLFFCRACSIIPLIPNNR